MDSFWLHSLPGSDSSLITVDLHQKSSDLCLSNTDPSCCPVQPLPLKRLLLKRVYAKLPGHPSWFTGMFVKWYLKCHMYRLSWVSVWVLLLVLNLWLNSFVSLSQWKISLTEGEYRFCCRFLCWSLFLMLQHRVFSLGVLVTGSFDRRPDQPVTSSAADIWAIWKWLCVHDAGAQPFLFN